MWRLATAGLLWGSICISPVFAADNPVNDFTGTWARNSFNFEPIPGQPAPLVNLKRNADGTMDAGQIVGDYNNPILKTGGCRNRPQEGRDFQERPRLCGSLQQLRALSRRRSPMRWNWACKLFRAKDHITMLYAQDDQVRRVRLNSSHPRT